MTDRRASIRHVRHENSIAVRVFSVLLPIFLGFLAVFCFSIDSIFFQFDGWPFVKRVCVYLLLLFVFVCELIGMYFLRRSYVFPQHFFVSYC